jgi:uncharacterized RDD family membrane protein YckC
VSNEVPLPMFPREGADAPTHEDAPNYASWGRRVIPYVLDSLVIGLVALVITSVLGYHNPTNVFTYHVVNGKRQYDPVGTKLLAYGLISASVGFVYATAFLSSKLQATPFMRLFSLRIARADDQGTVVASTAALRTVIVEAIALAASFTLVLELLALVDFLWPLWDSRRQTIHDKLARTVVVRVPQKG